MSLDHSQKPMLIKWRAYALCPGCGCYQSFPPGHLNDDGSAEIRTCPEDGCSTQIETEPYGPAKPGEATVFNLY